MSGELTFPWARELGDEQRSAFIDDLWGAAGTGDDLATLDAIEKVITSYRPPSIRDVLPCLLNQRQLQALTHLAAGETVAGARTLMDLSENQMGRLLQRTYAKLGAHGTTGAVAIAMRCGWLPDDVPQLPTGDTPRRRRTSRPTNAQDWRKRHRESAEHMRSHPGEWQLVGPYTTRIGLDSAANDIGKGRMKPYQPAGAFEATTTTVGDAWFVRARFIGAPDHTERQPK
ncbi:hypothetical protein [Streptomyces sp. NPDC051016]|uniref:hypothetical protein n=1 Tax=Streptomyces sp. NPDC051016 TaxID=3365638 RepID=UPI00379B39A0